MSNNKILFVSILVAFLLGVLSTYLYMTKKQMDLLMKSNHNATIQNPIPNVENNNQEVEYSLDNIYEDANLAGAVNKKSVMNTNQISTNDYSQEQAKAIIDQMPDLVLEQYVDKFMTTDATNVITNKRRFAERAVEELYQSNDNRPLVGEIKLAYDSTLPNQSVDVGTIDKFAKVYAHLDTGGNVPSSPYVFVKWVNNKTGRVLLFEKKDIVENLNQNWVSFRPYDGWKVGSYDIRFYQFTSELEPIAQLTYDIYTVNDVADNDATNNSVAPATLN